MKTLKLNVGVIGTGAMGKHHARNYLKIPHVKLAAIADINEARGLSVAKENNCFFYKNYKDMLSHHPIKAVSIAVPTSLHHAIALDCLRRGIHVLLEKPIASNLKQAQSLIHKAREKKVTLMVGHIERFNPAVQKVKKLIEKGLLGKIVSLNIKRVGTLAIAQKDTNVISDLAIHDIDISNYLLNEYPKQISSFATRNITKDREDSVAILLKYAKTSSFLEANWITPVKIRSLDITGTKAFARLDYIKQSVMFYKNKHAKKYDFKDFSDFMARFTATPEINIPLEKKEPLLCELENFVHVITRGKKPLISNEDAYKALEIALAINHSFI